MPPDCMGQILLVHSRKMQVQGYGKTPSDFRLSLHTSAKCGATKARICVR
jgi:hypothetical protein